MCEMFLDFFFANIFFLLILLLCQSLFHSQSTWHNCRFLLMWLCTTGWEWNPFSAVMSRLSPFNQVSIILVTFEGGYRFSLVHLNISFPVLSAWICLSVLFHFALVIIMITVNVFLMRWIPLWYMCEAKSAMREKLQLYTCTLSLPLTPLSQRFKCFFKKVTRTWDSSWILFPVNQSLNCPLKCEEEC